MHKDFRQVAIEGFFNYQRRKSDYNPPRKFVTH